MSLSILSILSIPREQPAIASRAPCSSVRNRSGHLFLELRSEATPLRPPRVAYESAYRLDYDVNARQNAKLVFCRFWKTCRDG